MSLTHEQKAAIAGGLQQHSVGALYPLLVVGIDHHKYGLCWVVQNLQTGAYAALRPPSGKRGALAFSTATYAQAVAQFVAAGIRRLGWVAGPLSRDVEGALVIGAQQETPRQAFYNSLDTDTD